jgi:2-iminobutanoate/2-iminopropanoate deaminase
VKRVMNPEGLPRPGGAYSLAVRKGNLVFVAGLVGMDAERRLAGDDIQSQTQKALENLRGALTGSGATLDDVCSVTVFLANADRDFGQFNEVYGRFFLSDPPARATVEARIPGGALVEIQAVAVLD